MSKYGRDDLDLDIVPGAPIGTVSRLYTLDEARAALAKIDAQPKDETGTNCGRGCSYMDPCSPAQPVEARESDVDDSAGLLIKPLDFEFAAPHPEPSPEAQQALTDEDDDAIDDLVNRAYNEGTTPLDRIGHIVGAVRVWVRDRMAQQSQPFECKADACNDDPTKCLCGYVKAQQAQPPLAPTAWAEAWDKANNGKPGYIPYEPAPQQAQPRKASGFCSHHQYPDEDARDYDPSCNICWGQQAQPCLYCNRPARPNALCQPCYQALSTTGRLPEDRPDPKLQPTTTRFYP
jgi:hypothetical protein